MGIAGNDKLAIHELMGRAAYGYDERDLDVLTACFAKRAIMSMRIAGGDLIGPFEGRDAILGLMTSSMEEQTDVRRHVVSNLFFPEEDAEEEGDEPLVISNLTLFGTENGVTRLISAGIYRDRVALVDGRWQIVHRHLDLDAAY